MSVDLSKLSDEQLLELERQAVMPTIKSNQLSPVQMPSPANMVQNYDLSKMSDEELLDLEKNINLPPQDQVPGPTLPGQPYDPMVAYQENPEARLGFGTRFQYALEPLESNRRALLIQEFGRENVLQDNEGNLFVVQDGVPRPANAPGLSQADIPEFFAAMPEGIGVATGAALGAGAGGPAGAIPGAILGGAAGGAVRQAVSSLVTDTPQVAEPSERAANVAISGGLGLLGYGAGKAVGSLGKAVWQKVAPKAAKRAMTVTSEMKKFGMKPTLGQKYGGSLQRQEKQLEKIPIFGRSVRTEIAKQSEKVADIVKKEIGDVADDTINAPQAGMRLKNIASEQIKQIKSGASELFEDFTERAKDINLDATGTKNSFLGRIKKFNLFDMKGNPLPYNPEKSAIPMKEYRQVQNVIKPLIQAFDRAKSEPIEQAGKQVKRRIISANAVNNLRKSLDGSVSIFQTEGKQAGISDATLLKVRSAFMDAVENGLEKQGDESLLLFKTARVMWSDAMKKNKLAQDLGINLANTKRLIADEKVLNKIMLDTKNYEKLVDVVGKKTAKEAANKFLEDIGKKSASFGDTSAARLLSGINKSRPVLEKALGKDKITNIRKLLEVAKENAIPVNPSMTEITRMEGSLSEIASKGITLKTIRGLVEGGIKLPANIDKATRYGIQTSGQKKKRMMAYPQGKRKLNINK